MVNQQLLEYVRAQRTAGLSKEAIIKAAAPGGWTPEDLQEVFDTLDGVKKPPVAPLQPPPAPHTPAPAAAPVPEPMQPRVITPPPQPAGKPPMTSPAVQPMQRPVVSPAEVTTAPVARRSLKGLYITLGIVVGILVLAAGGYFFVWPFVQQSLSAIRQTQAELEPPASPIEPTPVTPEAPDASAQGTASTTPDDTSASTTASSTDMTGDTSATDATSSSTSSTSVE